MEFRYNADGIRTSKTIGGIEHVYTLNGTQIVSEAWGDYLLIYLYDESGSPIGMQYRETSYAADVYDTFYFEKNLQGDIIAVYNENGLKIVSYNYDAWGNHTYTWHNTSSANIPAAYNPFRYRGYYYDTDTGLYYLQSRYYNPQWGRFLNEDGLIYSQAGLIGYNMYTYCGNNPVMGYDPSGYAEVDTKDDEDGNPINDFGPVNTGNGNMSYKGGNGSGGPSGSSQNMCGQVYRGGDYTARPIDVRIDKSTGKMKTGWGISVNTNPSKVSSFGAVSRVDSIPNGLKIIQTKGLGHYEIVPVNPMTLAQYQELLNHIEYTIIR